MFIAFFDPTVLSKDLSDEFLYNTFKFISLEDKLNFRLVCQHWKEIINWQLKLIITIASYPVYRLYEKCDELYLTSFPLSSSIFDNNKKSQDQIVNWDRDRDQNENEDQLSSSTSCSSNNLNNQIFIPHSPQEIFEHFDLETIHIGPGVSGLSKEILRKIFACTSTKLRELSWVIAVHEQHGERKLNTTSIFDGISFANITDLSLKLKLVQRSRSPLDPSSTNHHENTVIFIQLLQKEFPMLHYLAVHLSSEPTIHTKQLDRHTNNHYNKSTWSVYMEIFKFISNHSRTLRVLGLDYYNLNLETPLMEHVKNPDQWLWAMHADEVKAIGSKFRNLKLQILNLYCGKKEGSLPWILGANLLSSQSHLTELVLKAQETSLQSSLEDTLLKTNKTLRYLRLTMTGFSVDFNFNLIRKHKLLRGIELSCFRSLQNPQDIPVNVTKLKLKSNFSTSDVTRILNKCCKLRKLTLQHDGTFWKPVTVETIKMCLENSTSLAKLCMYNFEEDSTEDYCESRDDLRFSIGGKHKGCIKISHGTVEH